MSSGNKGFCLSNFIKQHPYIFYGIIIGSAVATVTTVTLCVTLIKKENEEIPNTDMPEITPSTPSIEENQNIFPLEESSNLEVMNIYNNIGNNDKGTLDEFCEHLSQFSNLEDEQKVYLAYYWIINNIVYDYDGYRNKNSEPLPENYFRQRKTICAGYSFLFRKFLLCMNYPESKIKIINGYSKGEGYSPFEEPIVNHAWNAVEIKGQWCLVDATWDAGKSSNFYLCTPPRCFIRDHLPEDNDEYQFLKNPISLEKFHQSIDNAKGFCKYNIQIIEDKTIQNICGRGKVIIKFLDNSDSPDNHLIVGSYSDGRISFEYQNLNVPAFFVKRNDNGFEIDISVNEVGYFAIAIGMRDQGSSSFGGIYFNCQQEPTEKFYYPTMMIGYYDSNINLISPMQRDLTKGNSYNFELKTNDFDKLILNIGGEEFLMTKNGNTFKEDNIYIHGDYIYISTEEKTLLSYNTIGDDVDYPKSFSNNLYPRLIRPLIGKLSKGQEYTFELISETTENIKIIIEIINVTIDGLFVREGNVFKKTITIDSSITATKLKIRYISGYTFYNLYEYTLE